MSTSANICNQLRLTDISGRRWPLAVFLLALCGNAVVLTPSHAQSQPAVGEAKVVDPKVTEPKVIEIAQGLDRPWGLAFLPAGRMLVTERVGRMRYVESDGSLSAPLTGLPDSIAVEGQGGLLDIVLSPDFARDQTIFFAFSQSSQQGSRTAVARARLGATGLTAVKIIFTQTPAVESPAHFGSRLVFDRDGNLWITLGDRYFGAPRAQDLNSHFGKVVRIRPDGTIPKDNPFVGTTGARGEIWSIGHRNVQGAARHPQTGALWTHEHGAQGGDELNLVVAGKNYGWPVITWGIDYSGEKIGEGTSKPGLEQPLHYWVPSIAPSGMTFYTGDKFPQWRNSLLIGSLKFGLLVRLSLEGEKVVGEERLLSNLGARVRDVRQGPDGYVYLLTDSSNGRILKLMP
jgi:aldose sugar dehydrogenase